MDTLIQNLTAIVGSSAVLSDADELLVYECDGLPQHKYRPRAVVFPSSTEETAEVMRLLAQEQVPFTPRGAGTGLSGGALALDRGVVIEFARMRKILKIDEANRMAVVQPGVVNLHVSLAVAHLGLHYVPDPSSQPTCTIGGNIAESAGGIHCLKYGTTTDHVLGLRVVLAGGEIVELGGSGTEKAGYDLLGTFVGSEGTFGITTEATLRLVPIPPAVRTLLAEFPDVNDASHAVSAIIAAGVMPAALEMMDREIIRAVEASVFAAGLPLDVGAALLIELDGLAVGIDEEAERVMGICLQNGARDCRLARDENERKKLWAARKGAFGAIGRIAPDSMIQDAVVPRSRLPEVLASVYSISAKYQLRIANVFHAGDGNLHPLICFDSRSADEVQRVKEAGRELMETCVRAGGSITGEHGVGFDKRELLPLIFSADDMNAMLAVRAAFDPTGLCNPGKIIPMLRGCGEAASLKSNVERPMSNAPEAHAVPLGRRASRPQSPDAVSLGPRASRPQPDAVSLGPRASRPQPDALSLGPRASRPQPPEAVSLGPRASRPQSPEAVSLGPRASRPQPPDAVSLGPRASRPQPPDAGLRNEVNSRSPFDPDKVTVNLSQLVGADNVSRSGNSLVVSPASVAEVCEVMKLANQEGWKVVPAGARTWLSSNQRLNSDVLLSTQRLNRIIEHEPADLIAITEAGVGFKIFNETLQQQGQWLPLYPPGIETATIGGVVATGLGGTHQFGYGAPRRHVIGLKVVLADGTLIKAGGKVVKNVAGYDLCKLFTGSYGSLGVIVEANFKLRPVPFETGTVMTQGPRELLLRKSREVISSRLFPVAIELLSPAQAGVAGLSDGKQHLLLLRFAGLTSAVSDQVSRALDLSVSNNGNPPGRVERLDDYVWRILAESREPSANEVVARVSLLPAHLDTFFDGLNRIRDQRGFFDLWQAGVGEGRIRFENRTEAADNDHSEDVERLERLRTLASDLGGTFTIESAPASLLNKLAPAEPDSAFGIMKRIKQQLDPGDVLPRIPIY